MSTTGAARSACLPWNIFVDAVAGAIAAEACAYITHTKSQTVVKRDCKTHSCKYNTHCASHIWQAKGTWNGHIHKLGGDGRKGVTFR